MIIRNVQDHNFRQVNLSLGYWHSEHKIYYPTASGEGE